MKRISLIILLPFICVTIGCKKFIEINGPLNKVADKDVFGQNATAIAAMTNVYYSMSENNLSLISYATGLAADEFNLYSDDQLLNTLYTNSISPFENRTSTYWEIMYHTIFRINTVLEGLTNSDDLSLAVKKQLTGEAKFARAFQYFYLVNLFGKVPIVLSTDYKLTYRLSRASTDDVYSQIIKDLIEAKEELNVNYVGTDAVTVSNERLRPNKSAAAALLARVYLFRGEWSKAEEEASFVISMNGQYELLSNLDDVFLKNSKEAIWQLQPIGELTKTIEARTYLLSENTGPNFEKNVTLSESLVQQFSPADLRRTHWINTSKIVDESSGQIIASYYYPTKYKNDISSSQTSEFSMVLRLAEVHLIRAEARAQQDKILGFTGAQYDLNLIRERSDLEPNITVSKSSMLRAIEDERRLELFTEWGDRWFYLKYNGRINTIMPEVSKLKGGSWESTDQLWPLPLSELRNNPNLAPQNAGY